VRILLSNDDGIAAPGLAALRQAVADLGEVTVVAPAGPQSAAGHSITLTHPLTVRRLRVAHVQAAFDGLSVDGRPADCVRLAIRNLLPSPPDLVLSGINAGANVGVNVFYSGTVAAAAEAAMFGIPAVAFSAALHDNQPLTPEQFAAVAAHCRRVLNQLLARGLAPGDLINVNIPPLTGQPHSRDTVVLPAVRVVPPSRGAGVSPALCDPLGKPEENIVPVSSPAVRVVPQSTSGVDDEYVLIPNPANPDQDQDTDWDQHMDQDPHTKRYRLGDTYAHRPDPTDTDVTQLAAGYITITPLHTDMTNHGRLNEMRQWMRDER